MPEAILLFSNKSCPKLSQSQLLPYKKKKKRRKGSIQMAFEGLKTLKPTIVSMINRNCLSQIGGVVGVREVKGVNLSE